MKLGITGLPNVGKSTLFNAVSQAGAEVANYPFCTIEPNIGVVEVPDARLRALHELHPDQKLVHATVSFVDIAGLVSGASKGEGLGNQFLGHIRDVQALVHVVRCFEDPGVAHVSGTVDPVADIETVQTELILADLDWLRRYIDGIRRRAKGDRSLLRTIELLEELEQHLNSGAPARTFAEGKQAWPAEVSLLSARPVIYVANVDEARAAAPEEDESVQAVIAYAAAEGAEALALSAALEAELSTLDEEERALFEQELGLEGSALDRLILASYRLLGLISFFTTRAPEVRAWTIRAGTKAPEAAGKIHTDFERGFIRAETITYDTLMERAGSIAQAREKGLLRSEGKEYVVQDGDVIQFLFNV